MHLVPQEATRDQSRFKELLGELNKTAGADFANGSERPWVNLCAARQALSRVAFEQPTILLVAMGRKTATVGDKVYSTDDGTLIIVPPGFQVSVVNIPHPLRGLFVGAALSFDRATLDQFRSLYAKHFEDWDLSPRWTLWASDKLLASIANWLRWSREFDVSKTELRHRLMEIMLILAEQGGVGNLLIESRDSATNRLRSLFALDPSRQWSAVEASLRLGMSVSSLQRRLREQNTGFRLLLEDVRLNRGLELVLSTDAQIGSIARSCGYESQSRFSERFRLRFSTSPSELRRTRVASVSRPGQAMAR